MHRQNRIKKRKEFDAVFKKGEKIADPNIVINFLRRGEELPTRLGIVVSGKIANACKRNRLKRLARECFRITLPHLREGYDIIIVFRRIATDIEFGTLRDRFERLVRSAGLWQEQKNDTDG